jgi:KDEL-tailed cysteine endopeptidase
MGVNQFTDLTPEEFKAQYVGGLKAEVGSYGCKSFSSSASGLTAPSAIDWRTKGAVNPVREQGQCGSCWAFATTANAESVWAISSGQLLDLSEEFLVDCVHWCGLF